jgi:hypothetical protein
MDSIDFGVVGIHGEDKPRGMAGGLDSVAMPEPGNGQSVCARPVSERNVILAIEERRAHRCRAKRKACCHPERAKHFHRAQLARTVPQIQGKWRWRLCPLPVFRLQ